MSNDRIAKALELLQKFPDNDLARYSLAQAYFNAGGLRKRYRHLRPLCAKKNYWMVVVVLDAGVEGLTPELGLLGLSLGIGFNFNYRDVLTFRQHRSWSFYKDAADVHWGVLVHCLTSKHPPNDKVGRWLCHARTQTLAQ